MPIYDRSANIVHSVADVQARSIIAFCAGRDGDLRVSRQSYRTLIPVVALPLSLLITFMAMRGLGYSLDNLSLMALTLAIGFLVDDAIVFLENTVRRMERGEPPFEAAINSAREISFTILSNDDLMAAVFIPLVFMTGLVGRIFREFAITIVIAILASGLGVTDAHAADVRAIVESARRGSSQDVDGTRYRGNRKTYSRFLRRIALVVSASSLDLTGDLGDSVSRVRSGSS
jgi:multidrug efflux pump subunit AcrB